MKNNNLENNWSEIKIKLSNIFENNNFYNNHFLKTKFYKSVNNKIYIICESIYAKTILSKTFKSQIETEFSNYVNTNFEIIFITDNDKKYIDENTVENIEYKKIDKLNENFIFDNYVVGKFNKNLYNAAISFIECKNVSLNPLFIYGTTGLGKTHILHAIGFEYSRMYPDKKIKYISTEDFLRETYAALSKGGIQIESYKNSFNDIDLLLIDDVQFLTNKDKLNEIFFNIFNYLKNNNKLIVLTSDKIPESLKIDDRMISRFNSGLTIKIPEPDVETIKEIIKEKILKVDRQNKFSNSSVNFLANRFNKDIRVLEGVINKILFYASLNYSSDQIITEEIVIEILNIDNENNLLGNNYSVNPNIIIDIVSSAYGLSSKLITSKQRKKEIMIARKVSMYILRKKLNMSYNEIGKYFSNRDHSTIINSITSISDEIQRNDELKKFIEKIIEQI